MLDTPRSEVVWRVLATLSIRLFPLHTFSSRASPCDITFQRGSTNLSSEFCYSLDVLFNRFVSKNWITRAIKMPTEWNLLLPRVHIGPFTVTTCPHRPIYCYHVSTSAHLLFPRVHIGPFTVTTCTHQPIYCSHVSTSAHLLLPRVHIGPFWPQWDRT